MKYSNMFIEHGLSLSLYESVKEKGGYGEYVRSLCLEFIDICPKEDLEYFYKVLKSENTKTRELLKAVLSEAPLQFLNSIFEVTTVGLPLNDIVHKSWVNEACKSYNLPPRTVYTKVRLILEY